MHTLKAALTLQIEHSALDSLLAHKARVTKAKEDLDALTETRLELCAIVAEPVADREVLRHALLEAMAAGNGPELQRLRAAMETDKAQLTRVEDAKRHLADVEWEITAIGKSLQTMRAEEDDLKYQALKDEAMRLGAVYRDKLNDLIESFLLCRAVAELAELHGPAIVPSSFRHGIRLEIPAPVLGMSPSGRILASLAPNAPEAAVARAKAAEIAKALID